MARKFAELDKSLAPEELEDVQQVEKTTRQLDAPDWQDGDGDSGLLFPSEQSRQRQSVDVGHRFGCLFCR